MLSTLSPTIASLLKAPPMKRPKIHDHYELRVCPSHRGYWVAIYEADSASTMPVHETDTFLSREDAVEVAGSWVDQRLDEENERAAL